jgi:hypothetical protein
MRRAMWAWAGLLILFAGRSAADEEKVFSGPQPGEKLTGFKVRGVYDKLAGKDLDFVAEARGKPTVLVFVHKLTRPSMALTRAVTVYGASRKKDGLHTYIVWLSGDRTEAEQYLKRASKSLNFKVPVGISLDGAEGPGAYGLNRKVTLTIIVARDNKVTANFALVQPGVTDAPDIGKAIVKVVGGKAPTLEELNALAFPKRGKRPAAGRDARLVGLLSQVIQKTAEPGDVKKAAAAVEKYVGENKRLQRQLGQMAAGGVARKLGTPAAQEQLKKWAEKYGPKKGDG